MENYEFIFTEIYIKLILKKEYSFINNYIMLYLFF